MPNAHKWARDTQGFVSWLKNPEHCPTDNVYIKHERLRLQQVQARAAANASSPVAVKAAAAEQQAASGGPAELGARWGCCGQVEGRA